jgi:hypothetical protein
MIEYDDDIHRYSFKGIRYLSATQVVSHFENEFLTEDVAQYMAEAYGHTPEHWAKKWEQEKLKSIVRGDGTHTEQEELLLNRSVDIIRAKEEQKKVFFVRNPVIMPGYDYYNWPDGTYPELKLWNHRWRIAGRTDKVTFETLNKERYAHVADHKTNKRLRSKGRYDKVKQTYQMMKFPLEHLHDCEMTRYTLQLSLYMFMLEAMGFLPGHLTIIHYPHVHPHAPEGAVEDPVLYDLTYMKKEVLLMLEYLRSQNLL